MKNTIAARVAEFLKLYPPFSLLDGNDLLFIAAQVKVLYAEKGKTIFKKGEKGHSWFYVIKEGAVALENIYENRTEAVDKCDEGDIFGLRPLFAKEDYLLNARTDEESILYGIPIEIFKPLAEKNAEVRDFLMQSFASNTRNPYAKEDKGKLVSTVESSLKKNSSLFEFQPAPLTRKVITLSPAATVKKAAELMSAKKLGSIIVVQSELPIGIITDEDFRDLIAKGNFSENMKVSEIMTSPVICYPKSITIAQAQITMMKHRINHICITEDGTPNTPITGILSEHNIMLSEGNNPSILMKAIQRSNSTNELKKIRNKVTLLLKGYLENNIPLTHISKIIFELNDATIKRIIERCIKKMPKDPPVQFAWLSLGSQGRKEQLLQTDQDNAIIFEDVPAGRIEVVRAYFLELAKKINKRLRIIGYEYCPVETMAKNPEWCRSLNEWKQQTSLWIQNRGNDEILLSSIFFDYDISYGDVRLSNALSNHIFEITRNNKLFLLALASTALRNPSPWAFSDSS